MKVKMQELMDNLQVDTIPALHDVLTQNDAVISQRTLYKWFAGGPFQSEKLEEVAKAAGVKATWLIETD